MGKKGKRPLQDEPEGEDPEELEGFVEGGELYLRDPTGVVYSSERDGEPSRFPCQTLATPPPR